MVEVENKDCAVKEVEVEGEEEVAKPTENKDQQVSDGKSAHQEKEAELEAYLESLKPKPKKRSIKEMLMCLPAFKDLAAVKPKIGGVDGKKEDVIFLDVESNDRRKSRDLKRQQQIEALKDRFVRHCITQPVKPGKGEHVKLKINKKEEDSQGIEHLVENEVDYVRNPLNEDDAVGFNTAQQSTSPQASAPGANRRRLQESLLEQIQARKLREYEEHAKNLKMYDDEMDENDEGGKSDEEIEEDDDELSENDSDAEDEEEEEELEDLLNSSTKTKKKKRSKSAFVDDEAEDEDADDDDADESNNEDSEDSDSTEEEDDEKEQQKQINENAGSKDLDDDDLASIGDSQNSLTLAQIPCNKVPEISTPVKGTPNDDSQKSADFEIEFTPKVTKAVLNHEEFKTTPSDFWIPTKSNLSCRQQSNELSLHGSDEKQINLDLPTSLANIMSEPKQRFDDLVDLCSGRFVSQVNGDLSESQEEEEFAGFDFGDDDNEACKESNVDKDNLKTPKANTSVTAVDGITPKLGEKVQKTRLLMQFDEEAEKTDEASRINEETKPIGSQDNNSLEDDDEIICTRIKGRKQKRLQFSDDEDEDEPKETHMRSSPHLDEQSEESELEEETEEEPPETVPEAPVSNGLFFNKHGRLKRKFVEDEAELSGSEEGSDDEDEKGLNYYEKEDGDEEEIDEDAVREQLERAHLKRLHDDDDANIRRLQDRYLENGDLHSDKQRERKFTWKINMDELNDDAHFGASDTDDENQPEDTPEEIAKKQAWIEKRKWLSENSHLLEEDEDTSRSLLSNSRFFKISKNTIKRLESFVDTSTSDSSNVIFKETVQRRSIYDEIIKSKNAARNSAVSLTSCSEEMNISSDTNGMSMDQSCQSMSEPLFGAGEATLANSSTAFKKGSFLSRGGMMLAKLAEGTKPADAVSNVKNNSRNFVFQHITPPNLQKTDGSTSKVKRVATKPGKQTAAKKMKIDRSFSNLDEASKGASIFKWL